MSLAVRFFGPANEHSGYGNAVINFAKAFSQSSVNTQFAFTESIKREYASFYNSLNNYNGKTQVDFYLHCPPWSQHQSLAKYKIAYFYWEADKLPAMWTHGINTINEIWAPCALVRDACIKAGFRGKIKIVPTPIDLWSTNKKVIFPSTFSDNFIVADDVYKFYSIFQWHERKGFRELLNAYYKTFTKKDKVLLTLKVNPLNISGNNKEKIKLQILDIKRKLNLKYYPPIYLIRNMVTTEEIKALHMTSNCYVSPHHGEGWGMPIHDAMISGKQIITTKFGGITEHLDDDSAYIINHVLGPVKNMSWSPFYSESQNWAYPKISHLRTLMRDAFDNKERHLYKGENAKKIANKMTIDKVSQFISNEITSSKIGV